VITGTMYPPLADLLFGVKISVGAPFFNATVLPLSIPLFAAMSIGPALPWKRAQLGPALIRLWWAALGAALVGLFVALRWRALPALAFAASAWLILGALAGIVERIRLFRLPLGDSLGRLTAMPRAAFGGAVAHAGLGVTLAGIAGMALATHTIALVQPGRSVREGGYDWRLVSLGDANGPDYAARVATIEVTSGGRVIATLRPERRTYPIQHTTATDTAIRTNGIADLYAVLGDERDGGAVLRLHYNPLAPWIWLGALVMATGGLLSLSDRRLRVGAPARRAVTVPA
jgi:cytochrome c-type biogenesis protein CcmF